MPVERAIDQSPSRRSQRPTCSSEKIRSVGFKETPASLGRPTRSNWLGLSNAHVATVTRRRLDGGNARQTLLASPSIGSVDWTITRRPRDRDATTWGSRGSFSS